MQRGITQQRSVAGVCTLALLCFGSFASLQAAPPADAKPKEDDKGSKTVTFRSVDGVDLNGTYYAVKEGRKEATVLLLHDFSKQKGGDSHNDDMDKLAEQLQAAGYPVLSFDFRGFGNSKNVSADVFWSVPTNKLVLPRGFNPRNPPTSIDAKTFPPAYFPHLVDDVSAAKAYLDRRSVAKELNSSNLVLVGAGQGATVGLMWAESQFRLVRLKGGTLLRPEFDEPEGKDLVGMVWLTMSPELEGIRVPLVRYLEDFEKKYKVPMVFVYGAGDQGAERQTLAWLQSFVPNYKKMGSEGLFNEADKGNKYTRDLAIKDTKLVGGKLLTAELPTSGNIVKYLDEYLKDRGGLRDPRRIETEKFGYYWAPLTGRIIEAKGQTEEYVRPVNLRVLLLGNN